MNINDLETCELVECDNQIIGGKPKTYVQGNAKAQPGKAQADVVAVALGDQTSTKTSTGANVSSRSATSYFVGSALARTGNEYDVSYDSGFDYSYQK